MKTIFTLSACLLGMTLSVSAQAKLPRMVSAKDKVALQGQSSSIAKQITPVVKQVSQSVVSIQKKDSHGKSWQTLALGTVTDKGIVTKWSEVSRFINSAKIVVPGKPAMPLKVIGIYPEYDLVLLSDEIGLTPIGFDKLAPADIGDFIVLSSVSGQPAGFGVVSVLERSLRESDKAFLGIQMNFKEMKENGVLLERIVPETGAAIAGLKVGDRMLSIDGRELGSPVETRAVIQKLKPGQKIKIMATRGDDTKEFNVTLGSRPKVGAFPAGRLNQMERMGGAISQVRAGFPSAIQSDMQVGKQFMGGPVVDLEGRLVGLSISRSRIKTHLIPADDLMALLKKKPVAVNVANVEKLARSAQDRSVIPKVSRKKSTTDSFDKLFNDLFSDPRMGFDEAPKRDSKQRIQQMQKRMEEMMEEMQLLEKELQKKR